MTSLKINRLLPMATINMHMKFEIEIPKQTWLMLRKPCRLQTDGRTDGQTDRRTRWIQYTPPPTSLGGGIISMISSGNGLLPAWHQAITELMPTFHYIDSVAFIWEQFHNVYRLLFCMKSLKIILFRFQLYLPGANELTILNSMHRQFSNIRRTQSPNINVFRLVLQLLLTNPLKPGVKLISKM